MGNSLVVSVFFFEYFLWCEWGSCPLVLFLRFFGLSEEYEIAKAKSLETSIPRPIPSGHFVRMTVTLPSLHFFGWVRHSYTYTHTYTYIHIHTHIYIYMYRIPKSSYDS